jgi:hypothetical protein
MLCLLGVILILIAVYTSSNRNFDQLFNCLIVIVILLAGSVFAQSSPKETFLGSAPVNHTFGQCDGKVLKEDDAITKYQNISWEGHRLQLKNPHQKIELIPEPIIYSPIGEGYKLGTDPTLDRKMSLFAHNYSSPSCCGKGAGYSTDTGCICMTEEQKELIGSRGGNASSSS